MATAQRSPLDIARHLQGRSTDFTHETMTQQDLDDFSLILSKFLDLEKRRELMHQQQIQYQKVKRGQDLDYREAKKKRDTERAAHRYSNDEEYRNRMLQYKKNYYARKKEQASSDHQNVSEPQSLPSLLIVS